MEKSNQSQLENFDNKMLLSGLEVADRTAFYKKTYAHVAGGVLVFILFEWLLLQSETIVEFALSNDARNEMAVNARRFYACDDLC